MPGCAGGAAGVPVGDGAAVATPAVVLIVGEGPSPEGPGPGEIRAKSPKVVTTATKDAARAASVLRGCHAPFVRSESVASDAVMSG